MTGSAVEATAAADAAHPAETAMLPRIAVVGYASLDHAMRIGEFKGVDATSIVRDRLGSSWPATGGIAHIAKAVQATGAARAEAVSWVGPDDFGRLWHQRVLESGCGAGGVVTAGSRSPSSYLLYLDTGSTICLFDPADCHGDGLRPGQQQLLDGVRWCVINVGPQAATRELLQRLTVKTKLIWAVKQDADATPPDLVEQLLARADVVSFSEGERPFLSAGGRSPEQKCAPGTLLIETQGARGVSYCFATGDAPSAGECQAPHRMPAIAVDAADTTGAGDTFIGTLAALIAASGSIDCDRIAGQIEAAQTAVAAMLSARTNAELRSGRAGHPFAAANQNF